MKEWRQSNRLNYFGWFVDPAWCALSTFRPNLAN